MRAILFLSVVLASATVLADDAVDRVLAWKHANGLHDTFVSFRTWSDDGRLIRVTGFERLGYTNVATEANAISPSALDAWLAERDALDPEVASLQSDLTNAVAQAFGVMPPYEPGVQSNYRTILRRQMKSARAGVDSASSIDELKAAQRTLNQRQYILNLIRELRVADPDWTLGSVQ